MGRKGLDGARDPSQFVGRYEEGVVAMHKKKQAGLPASGERATPWPQNVTNVMDMLRRSIAERRTAAARPKQDRKRGAGQSEMLPAIAGNRARKPQQNQPGEQADKRAGYSVQTFLRPGSDADRRDTVGSDWTKTLTPRAADDSAPILVPYGAGIWTFGDHLRHLAAHNGHIPLPLDEFGRCVICVRRGFFTPNA